MLWPEKKLFSRLGFIFFKFTKGGGMLLGPFMSVKATTKCCLQEPRPRNYTGCDSDIECAVKMISSLSHVFVEQVVSPESDMAKSEEVQKAGKKYLAGRKDGTVAHRQIVSERD